jgi:hypothetical protein
MFSNLALTGKSRRLLLCVLRMLSALGIAPSRWGVAMGLYTVGFVSFGVTNAFCAAIFPRLARNTRHVREFKERYEQDQITADEYEQAEVLEKSKISSLSMVCGLFAIR